MPLKGSWYLVSEESTITTSAGLTLTDATSYPPRQALVVYTDNTITRYVGSSSTKATYTLSASGTSYTYTTGSTAHTVEITALNNAQLITKDSYRDGTSAVVKISTLTP